MTPEIQRKKVLIVDDDMGIRLMIRRLLSREEKYDLEEAKDGFEAEEKLKIFNADLIILDILMPGKDGYATCQDIRKNERLKDVKILGISGESGEIGKIFVEAYGANRFLEKPFNAAEFKEIVTGLLSGESVAEGEGRGGQ